jgi:hypothetical protein
MSAGTANGSRPGPFQAPDDGAQRAEGERARTSAAETKPWAAESQRGEPQPAEYLLKQAARFRELAAHATTGTVKERLTELVRRYEQLAEDATRRTGPTEP